MARPYSILAIMVLLLISLKSLAEESSNNQNNVYIFTQTFCPECIYAKQYMKKNNIQFIELDIETNQTALTAFQKINGRGTPMFVINKQIKYGFDPTFIQSNLYP